MAKSGFRDSQQSFPDGSRGTPKAPSPLPPHHPWGWGRRAGGRVRFGRLGAGLEVGSDFGRVGAGSWAPSRFGD